MHTEVMTAYTGPILDAHVHLWNPRTTPRLVSPLVKTLGWSPKLLNWATHKAFPSDALHFVGTPRYALLNYLEEDWALDTAGHASGFVHIEAGWQCGPTETPRETEWLERTCGPRLKAIVGHASLGHPELASTLDAHVRASKRFVGVRDKLAYSDARTVMRWSAGPKVIDEAAWQRGYALLGERGLTFDAWCYGHQLPALAKLFAAHPNTRAVLDHLGTPIGAGGRFIGVVESEAARDRAFKTWQEDLQRVAENPQVFAKISGLTMPIVGLGFDARKEPVSVSEVVEKLGPFVNFALTTFGAKRCFFASNFPMDKVSLPWTLLFEAFDQLSRHLGPETQHDLFERNALRFYLQNETGTPRDASAL